MLIFILSLYAALTSAKKLNCGRCSKSECDKEMCPDSAPYMCTKGDAYFGCASSRWEDNSACQSCCDTSKCDSRGRRLDDARRMGNRRNEWEEGFCTVHGEDQNDGVIKVNDIDGNTQDAQDACMDACKDHDGATGCEVIWDQGNRGCYIHTQEITEANGVDHHLCALFVEDDDRFDFDSSSDDDRRLDNDARRIGRKNEWEEGFCTIHGEDQNDGVIKVNDIDGDTEDAQDACMDACKDHDGATGCEVIWDQGNRGCYIHTQEITEANGYDHHLCALFVEDDDRFDFDSSSDDDRRLDNDAGRIGRSTSSDKRGGGSDMLKCGKCSIKNCDIEMCPSSAPFMCTKGDAFFGCSGSGWEDNSACSSCCDTSKCLQRRLGKGNVSGDDIGEGLDEADGSGLDLDDGSNFMDTTVDVVNSGIDRIDDVLTRRMGRFLSRRLGRDSSTLKCGKCSKKECDTELCPSSAPFMCTKGDAYFGCASSEWENNSACQSCCDTSKCR